MSKLSDKQRRFADEYLANGMSAMDAYKAAGYKGQYPDKNAHKVLANPNVKEYIREKGKSVETKLGISQELLVEEELRILNIWTKIVDLTEKGVNRTQTETNTMRELKSLINARDVDNAKKSLRSLLGLDAEASVKLALMKNKVDQNKDDDDNSEGIQIQINV